MLPEPQHERWVVKPVVLGLGLSPLRMKASAGRPDGAERISRRWYEEVLAGLADGEQVATGASAGSVPII